MIIAIDGPAGSGKSTVAKAVAVRLGFRYLDTGAMYRALAVLADERGVAHDDGVALAKLASESTVSFLHEPGAAIASRVLIGGQDVTQAIRTPAADAAVSAVASVPEVRRAMVEQQRAIGRGSDIVVEGRDIGTVVFPDAALKVFLTASSDERARRRTAEQRDRGLEVEHDAVHAALVSRDTADSTREASPLQASADAIVVDTTSLSIEQVVDTIADLARETSG